MPLEGKVKPLHSSVHLGSLERVTISQNCLGISDPSQMIRERSSLTGIQAIRGRLLFGQRKHTKWYITHPSPPQQTLCCPIHPHPKRPVWTGPILFSCGSMFCMVIHYFVLIFLIPACDDASLLVASREPAVAQNLNWASQSCHESKHPQC